MADIATILGLIIALLAVGVGMVLKGANPGVLLNPAAFLIIFVGTFGALFVAFPLNQMKQFPAILKIAFTGKKLQNKGALIKEMTGYTNMVRREGLLAIDVILDTIEDPFMKKALTLATSTNSPEDLERILETEIDAVHERHKIGATMFSQAGAYAPSLGVLGAVVGLIAALGNLSDIEKLGHSIAAAFVATLLGIFTGYVLWTPLANKMKIFGQQEQEIMNLIMTGVLCIQRGDHVYTVEQELLSKLSPAEVRAYETLKEESKVHVQEKEQHEEHMNESWLIPYADLLTLLLALFIVLFATSQVDAEKFAQMKSAFITIFEGSGYAIGSGGNGIVDGGGSGSGSSESFDWSQFTEPSSETSATETSPSGTGTGNGIPLEQRLEDLQNKFDDYIMNHELDGKLHTEIRDKTVMIVISDIVLFDSGMANIKPNFRETVHAIGNILAETPGLEIQILGHTDNVPMTSKSFETNWDLSTARAINFMKLLLEDKRLDPSQYSAIGYGEYRPLTTNDTAEGRALNRRVEVTARYIAD